MIREFFINKLFTTKEVRRMSDRVRNVALGDVLDLVNRFDENPTDNYGPSYGAALEDMRQAIRKLKQE